ncbi:hypothetical protein BD779DRAFT_136351 [Infundibulicybe gibba]|nr:hypothetical protein BD779DRAFT_136351 [Infundibulicybe gibba]
MQVYELIVSAKWEYSLVYKNGHWTQFGLHISSAATIPFLHGLYLSGALCWVTTLRIYFSFNEYCPAVSNYPHKQFSSPEHGHLREGENRRFLYSVLHTSCSWGSRYGPYQQTYTAVITTNFYPHCSCFFHNNRKIHRNPHDCGQSRLFSQIGRVQLPISGNSDRAALRRILYHRHH